MYAVALLAGALTILVTMAVASMADGVRLAPGRTAIHASAASACAGGVGLLAAAINAAAGASDWPLLLAATAGVFLVAATFGVAAIMDRR